MKKLILCIVLFFGCTIIAEAQWTRLDLPPGQYRDIFFSAEKTGFLVGDSGMVLKTVDDGVTWRKIDVGVNANFLSVAFITPTTGFILSRDKLFKSTDAGETWLEVKSDSVLGGIRISFINDKVGFIERSSPGPLLKTKDGGENWYRVSCVFKKGDKPVSNFSGNDVAFGTAAVGYSFVTEYMMHGLFKTVDSGDTWEFVQPETYDGLSGQIFEALWFHDENNGVWGGWYFSFLSSTNDGGKNWESATHPIPEYLWLKDNSGLIRNGVYDIFFPTKQIGYAAAQANRYENTGYASGLLKTKDGGKNWTYFPIDREIYWYPNSGSKVYFTNENTGYLVSTSQVLKTTTGGEEPVSVQEPLLKTISTNISPNPFKNSARIILPENSVCNNCAVHLYDVSGRDVTARFSLKKGDREILIEKADVPSGEYIFTVTEEGKLVLTGKFLKETE